LNISGEATIISFDIIAVMNAAEIGIENLLPLVGPDQFCDVLSCVSANEGNYLRYAWGMGGAMQKD